MSEVPKRNRNVNFILADTGHTWCDLTLIVHFPSQGADSYFLFGDRGDRSDHVEIRLPRWWKSRSRWSERHERQCWPLCSVLSNGPQTSNLIKDDKIESNLCCNAHFDYPEGLIPGLIPAVNQEECKISLANLRNFPWKLGNLAWQNTLNELSLSRKFPCHPLQTLQFTIWL